MLSIFIVTITLLPTALVIDEKLKTFFSKLCKKKGLEIVPFSCNSAVAFCTRIKWVIAAVFTVLGIVSFYSATLINLQIQPQGLLPTDNSLLQLDRKIQK